MGPWCPYCGSADVTQEGLHYILIRMGYYKCLTCGKTGKPIIAAASEPVTQPA